MQSIHFFSKWAAVTLLAAASLGSGFAQTPDQQYPPQGQYPSQGQPYPPAQGQYPPPNYPQGSQYPPGGQYPAPAQSPQSGQYPPPGYPPPPSLSPQQLDQLTGPIALYPDGLLAQVLTASTYSNQIPDAAGWANAHQYIRGDALAQAMRADNVNFDPSIMALLPFPSVLNYMAQYPAWTQALGNAVLTERDGVMDSVQRLRAEASNYGYLQNNGYTRVVNAGPGQIEILPVNPGAYYVPYYNPGIVYARPRPGFVLGGAIRFGAGITIGAGFAPWGWGGAGFGWRQHSILIDNRAWNRTWANRGSYAHPYSEPYRRAAGPQVEHHEFHGGHDGHDRHDDRGHGDHH